MKLQYASTEALSLSFPPFFNGVSGTYVVDGLGTTQFIVRKPDNTTQIVAASFDTDVKFWKAEIAIGSFQEGIWLIKAESDVGSTIDQFRALSWGDYVDDIGETRQAALGRWKIVGTQLVIYEDDGTTPFKTFNLLDSEGFPSVSGVFERTPV
jgi:hypothetical protein